jgi:hypothetical protein
VNFWRVSLRLVCFIPAAAGALPPSLAVSADPPHVLFAPCPNVVVTEPPPCVHRDGVNIKLITCTAPGPYWFSSATGLGCAGRVANIKIEMARLQRQDGTMRTQYVLTYNLYTGNGFQKDHSGFHIDMKQQNGDVLKDVLGGRIEFDLGRCYYGSGQDFRIPPFGLPKVTPFDFTDKDVSSLVIRVDPATDTGKHFHC